MGWPLSCRADKEREILEKLGCFLWSPADELRRRAGNTKARNVVWHVCASVQKWGLCILLLTAQMANNLQPPSRIRPPRWALATITHARLRGVQNSQSARRREIRNSFMFFHLELKKSSVASICHTDWLWRPQVVGLSIFSVNMDALTYPSALLDCDP